jgi:regulator of sirC expression with transglutaminase-like and TPR domain
LSSADPRAAISHVHVVLFDECGFGGDASVYDDPESSYLPTVLERTRGLPVLLALIYKLVVEQLGPVVHGVNAPAHFLVRVKATPPFVPMLVDPFLGGRVLSIPEALARVREVTGEAFQLDADNLPLATHRDWLVRIIRNLVGVLHARGDDRDRRAMEELMLLVRG